MSNMSQRRMLHFVFKIGDRARNMDFYKNVLGMKVLRHEEFEKGCSATCNGPYDGTWSKTMIGYGHEDDNFVVELTYNYGIGTYQRGNDFLGLTVESPSAFENALKANPTTGEGGVVKLASPDGYEFKIYKKQAGTMDSVTMVSLASSDLGKSIEFWGGILGMTIFEKQVESAILGYSENQCKLQLVDIHKAVDCGSAFGRTAISCPVDELKAFEGRVKEHGGRILTNFISLDTPGKATVSVVIVADPDGHEICFVGDEAFRELSQVDTNADAALDKAISADKSDEWYAKKGKPKPEA